MRHSQTWQVSLIFLFLKSLEKLCCIFKSCWSRKITS